MNFNKFLLISISFFLISGGFVFAITAGSIPTSGDIGIQKVLQDETPTGLKGILTTVVRWVYIIFFIVAVMFILFAAYTYLTAQGDAEKIKSANNQLIYAAIAVIVAFMSLGIDLLVKSLLKEGGGGGAGQGKEYWPTPQAPSFQWTPGGGIQRK